MRSAATKKTNGGAVAPQKAEGPPRASKSPSDLKTAKDEKGKDISSPADTKWAEQLLIDGETFELGSFSYTAAAEHKNAEKVLVLHDPAVAQRYAQESERLWAE